MKTFYSRIIYSLISVIFFSSCHSSKDTAAVTGPASQLLPWELKYSRGPCFGQCPVYTFYLLADNNGLIEVKANLLEPGWYQCTLDQESVHAIIMDIEPISWWNEDLSDEPEIADLPSSSIYYKHTDGMRSLAVQSKISNQVGVVFQKLGHLIQEARWVPTTHRPLEPDIPEPTDLIIQLKEGVDVHDWMKKYDPYGIQIKKRITPKLQYFLVCKDPSKGSSNDFFQHIKHDEDVIDAQWDKPLTPRGQ